MVDRPKNIEDEANSAKARAHALLREIGGEAGARKAATSAVGDGSADRARARARLLLDPIELGGATMGPLSEPQAQRIFELPQVHEPIIDKLQPESLQGIDRSAARGPVVEIQSGIAPVSVAIATFNRADWLAAAMKSCHEQSVRPQQVIVVDDGSDDATALTVAAFKSLDVVYVNPGRIGLGNARNLATALCQTRYLCVLDDDDIMLPNRVRDHMATFSEGAQISHGGWINFSEDLELTYWPGKKVTEDVIVYVGAAVTHGACCYETSLLREFPYREDIVSGADYDLAIRAIRGGAKCTHTGSYVLLRRMHQASMTVRYAEGQSGVRNSIIGSINLGRNDQEIARRTAEAMCEPELVAIESPRLDELYSIIGKPASAMYVVGAAPRKAGELFGLLDNLGWDWSEFDILDVEPVLTSTVMLMSGPIMDVSVLSAAETAMRRHGVKCRVYANPRNDLSPTEVPMDYQTPPGSFRVRLISDDLQRLYRAYRSLDSQRSWIWYVQGRRYEAAVNASRFGLVTAPFKARESSELQRAYIDNIRNLIGQHTDLRCEIEGLPS